MGTSRSGTGPGSHVPLVPPWVPDLPVSPDDSQPDSEEDGRSRLPEKGRFGPTRRAMGSFARSGTVSDLQRGLGHYVRRGYGGSRTATQRMGGTVRAAGSLYNVLSSGHRDGQNASDSTLDLSNLDGRSADEIMDALAGLVKPVDGTQDAEAGRDAVRAALSELLSRFPDADLLRLSQDQRLFAVERYIALDVYNMFCLDVGKHLHERAPSAVEALARLNDVKEYLVEAVSSRFRSLRNTGEAITGTKVSELAKRTLQETFEVFQEYVT